MKRIFSLILVVLNCYQAAYSQFKSAMGGLSFEAHSFISVVGSAKAGGGVALIGKAKPKNDDASFAILSTHIVDGSDGESTINFKTTKCDVDLSSQTWLIRDAIMVVNAEREDNLVRDVNILGTPTENEKDSFPESKYFFTELNKELIGTKTGEILLLADLLQTDVSFYADSTISRETDIINYERSNRELFEESWNSSRKIWDSYDSIKYVAKLSPLDSFSVFIILGIILILWYGIPLHAFPIAMIWMCACIIIGSGIGFLFGIPKIYQGGAANSSNTDGRDYKSQVNTNLTEISDWLTKIIVGLGLVNLTKIPPYVSSVAKVLAAGINDSSSGSALAFAYGLVCCYTVLGFLFGYLFTRLVLSKAFSIADQESAQQLEIESNLGEIKQNVESNVKPLETAPVGLDHMRTQSTKSEDKTRAAETTAIDKDAKLEELYRKSIDYTNINDPDYKTRVKAKDKAANELGSFAINNGITKDDIKKLIDTKSDAGGLVATLATLIITNPERGDVELLLQVGRRSVNKHTRYRVLLAINNLIRNGFVDAHNSGAIKNIVQSFSIGADESLNSAIKSTMSLLSPS